MKNLSKQGGNPEIHLTRPPRLEGGNRSRLFRKMKKSIVPSLLVRRLSKKMSLKKVDDDND